MLLDIATSNFRVFASEAGLSFVNPSLKTQTPKPPQTWESSTYRVAAVYGANASGKSTLLDALQTLAHAVANPGHTLYAPHAQASADLPTTYDVNFTRTGIRYHYTVEAMPWGIRSEVLHAYPKGTSRLLFQRTQQSADTPIEVKSGPSLTGPTAEVKRLLTATDLLLAVASRYQHKTLAPVSQGLRAGTSIASVNRSDQSTEDWVQWIISRLIENPKRWQGIVKALAHMADLGISDVRVQEEQIPPEVLERMRALLAVGSDDLSTQIPDDALPSVVRLLVFTHSDNEGRTFDLGLGAQSTGTLTWLTTAGPAVNAIARGDLLVVDELDASLHPTLAAAMVRMFKDPDINTTGAQILFSTHDTSLLGNAPSKVLAPGEVWFCEKHGTSSEVFSLADFDTRASNNEQKRYLTGRFGALPDVDFSRVMEAIDIARAPQTAG
ncbi:AAA family ATPase [Actinomyces glycerinitolerans]|uniref:Atpase aaa-type core n=1 Tax=Actinomyces glycerinitolerans TaxID=1892869 RepID=A0A1M4RZZ4_9ACTO|nr:ATP-binding protein [Actinomyces glycerinitolerans]SHE25470.1 atpase aaa-type core [Actinomyces glycerinitolerans]